MTKKILKIVLISTLIFGFCITYVSATDINLNLPGTDNTTQSGDNQNDTQPSDNQNVDNSPSNENQENVNNNDLTAPTDIDHLQPSSTSTVSDSGLNVTNIINILLITVGVILILLAIAIIIRLK